MVHVDGEHPVADAVQHGFTLAHQVGEFGGLESERPPFEQSGQQAGRAGAEQQGAQGIGQRDREYGDQ